VKHRADRATVHERQIVHSSKGVESIPSKGYVLDSQCQHKKGDSSHLTQPLTRSLLCVTFSSSFIVVNVMREEKGLSMAHGKFISYLRVSTQRQGKSGLGLDAQRKAVTDYLDGGKWELLQELIEVESGKSKDRPKLAEALRLCRVYNATLIVAKLDRLARNVAFVSALMEAKVKFVAADLPEANELTVHIMAAMAEYEAKAISTRTKAALAVARERGVKLGGTHPGWNIGTLSEQGLALALKARRASTAAWAADLLPVVRDIQGQGATSLRRVATVLNDRGIPTRRGGQWTAVQVQRLLAVI